MMYRGSQASDEGVQQDLLPLIEGTIVNTKYGGPINTDHILFIASGAFHSVKPSDMIAELQGRLPIRVELQPLTKDDFYRILTEPHTNLIAQNVVCLASGGGSSHYCGLRKVDTHPRNLSPKLLLKWLHGCMRIHSRIGNYLA